MKRIVSIMGPLWCAGCGRRLTEGDPRHPDHGPAENPDPNCRICGRFGLALIATQERSA